MGEYLKTWIDRLALNREHTEDAFVGAAEWLFTNEPFQRFDSESELTRSGRGLGAESGRAKPLQILWKQILRTVDNSQVLGTAAFGDEIKRLNDHALVSD